MPPIYTLGHIHPVLDIGQPVAIWGVTRMIVRRFTKTIKGDFYFSKVNGWCESRTKKGLMLIVLSDILNETQIENICNLYEKGDFDGRLLADALIRTAANLNINNQPEGVK